MIEAVGWQYFDDYFRRCDELLTDDGLMLLQAITIDDRIYEVEKAARSFANTHVFPGGCLPSRGLIASCLERVTSMREVWIDDITEHYPPTLATWRERFFDAWERLRGARLRRALPPPLGLLPELLRGGLPRAADRRRPAALRQARRSVSGGVADGRRPRAAAADPRARRHRATIWDPVLAAARGRARGDRPRHAGLRRRAAAAAGGRGDRGQPGARRSTSATSAELGLERPHVAGNSPRRLGGAGNGPARLRRSVTALSPAGLWRGAARRALDARPRAGRGGCGRWSRSGSTVAAAARPRRRDLRRPPRAGARRGPGRELVLGWIDAEGYEAANRAMRRHVFDPAGYPEDVPVTLAWGELDRLVGAAAAGAAPGRRPLPGRCPASATPRPGTTPSWSPGCCSRAARSRRPRPESATGRTRATNS